MHNIISVRYHGNTHRNAQADAAAATGVRTEDVVVQRTHCYIDGQNVLLSANKKSVGLQCSSVHQSDVGGNTASVPLHGRLTNC